MNRPIRGRRAAPALAAILLAGTVAACGGDGAEAEARTAGESVTVLAPTDVATAELSSVRSGVALTGTLAPYRVVEVRAQVSGVATDVAVDRGDAVRAGQRLARIEAQGVVGQAAGARSQVAAAEAALAQASRELESARTLYEAGALSEIQFRGAQTQYEAAQAQLASARAAAAGAVEQAARTTVESPISGRVSARAVEGGEAVSPGQSLFTVVNSAFLELEGQVPVDQAVQVRAGQPVTFQLNAYPGRTFEGTVARVAPVADPDTRRVGVTLRLPNEDGQLIAGLFATGRVLTGGERRTVVVPAAAVRGEGEALHVWVVDGDRVVRRPVTVAERDEERGVAAIAEGLEGGERVVVAPGRIDEGTRIRIGAEAAPAAEPAGEEG